MGANQKISSMGEARAEARRPAWDAFRLSAESSPSSESWSGGQNARAAPPGRSAPEEVRRDASVAQVRLTAELGRGASGVVFRGRELLGRGEALCERGEALPGKRGEKAVKVIKFGDRGVPCPLEAAVMMSIRHPHVAAASMATVLRDPERQLCLLCEAADCDLAELVRKERRDKPASGKLLRRWTWQLASAVLCFHREHLIHADIKPANVLVYGGDLRLGDMTLVTRGQLSSGRPVLHHLHLGTPRYRAPEVRSNRGAGWSYPADMWSLGCTLFEMAHGHPFFQTPKGFSRERVEKALDGLIEEWAAARAACARSPGQGQGRSRSPGPAGPGRGALGRFLPPANSRAQREFNDLIFRLLDCDPDSRLTAEGCFAHPYIAAAGPPPPYVAESVSGPPGPEVPVGWSDRLVAYTAGMADVRPQLRELACRALVAKMNHKHPEYSELDDASREELIEAEIRVCEFLGWHLI